MKNELVVKNVGFCGAKLLAVQQKENGKIYAGINSILRELGFSEKQIEYRRDKWKADKVLSKGTLKFSGTLLGAKTGKDVWCIEIKRLPLALAKIEITPKLEKEMPELSEKLEKYQEDCADALAAAFLPSRDTPPMPQNGTVIQMYENNKWYVLTIGNDVYGLKPDEASIIRRATVAMLDNGVTQVEDVVRTMLDRFNRDCKLKCVDQWYVGTQVMVPVERATENY